MIEEDFLVIKLQPLLTHADTFAYTRVCFFLLKFFLHICMLYPNVCASYACMMVVEYLDCWPGVLLEPQRA